MTDFAGALEKALFDRLCARVTLARVFQNVPDNTPPPVVIVGDVDFENAAGKTGTLLRFTVQVDSVIAGNSRKALNALQAEVRDALHDWRPTATAEVKFGDCEVLSATGQQIVSDGGMVYLGQQAVQVWVQAAD